MYQFFDANAQLPDSLGKQMQDSGGELQQQLQHESTALQHTSEIDAVKLAVQQLQQWRQQQHQQESGSEPEYCGC